MKFSFDVIFLWVKCSFGYCELWIRTKKLRRFSWLKAEIAFGKISRFFLSCALGWIFTCLMMMILKFGIDLRIVLGLILIDLRFHFESLWITADSSYLLLLVFVSSLNDFDISFGSDGFFRTCKCMLGLMQCPRFFFWL